MRQITLHAVGQDTSASIQLEALNDNRFSLVIDETAMELELHWNGPQGGWVRNVQSGEMTPFYARIQDENVQAWLAGRIYSFTAPSLVPKQRRSTGHGMPQASGEIKAPMPGTILKILVSSGDKVEANVPLLIMESMKMEMTLTAPAAGQVVRVDCTVGQLVEMNKILVELEAVPDESVRS
jgi:biotin carboxyl carrier protein